MNNKKTIGILTGGGDCAGLNAVIASIVKAGAPAGHKFIGFEKGLEGLLNPVSYRELYPDNVRGISHLGGTILKTSNFGRFTSRIGSGESRNIPDDILQAAKNNLDKLGVDCLIVIGGDGTLSIALQLAEVGVNIIGVPKTIDNDLSSTDKTFGFSSAVEVAVDSLDKIHTTAASHDRILFVEVMGRHAGWIALNSGLAANANAILLPEFKVDIPELVGFLRKRKARRGSAIVVVAEGIELESGKFEQPKSDRLSENRLQGISTVLIDRIEQSCPGEFDMRNVILGHTQRGGSPDAEDRILAKRYGVAALEACEAGSFGQMVSLQNGQIGIVSIAEATGTMNRVSKATPAYTTAQKLGIYLNG